MTFQVSALPVEKVEVEGCPISYRVVGAGSPLLLIMGLGADGSVWQQHVESYARRFRCIIVDNRGVGRSGAPEGPYSTSQMADDCAAVVRAATNSPVAVVGLSMGGAIAQELALRHSSLVNGLVLVSAWARCDGYLSEVFDHLSATHGALDPQTFSRLLQLLIWSPPYVSEHLEELQATRYELGPAVPQSAFAAQCTACKNHEALSRLGLLKIPTLITAGADDVFTVPENAEQLHRAIPGSELEIIAGGHAHHWEQLELFNDLTLSWLDRHVVRVGGSEQRSQAESSL
jgi:pimeloyl-ACP methyl ester carboxylesterase